MMTGVVNGELMGILEQDGNKWRKVEVENKYAWLAGFLSGITVAINHFEVTYSKANFKTIEDYIEYKEKTKKSNSQSFGLWGIQVRKIAGQLDELYSDYKNLKIKMVDAVYIAKMELDGKRPELIKAQKRYLLMQPLDIDNEVLKMKTLDYKNIHDVQESRIKTGYFAEPKINEPTKSSDYNYISLFRYGIYK
jgi:hypothetical protein